MNLVRISKKLLVYIMLCMLACGLFLGCIKKASPLESWVGGYSYFVDTSPGKKMVYGINLYKDNDSYYARIYVEGTEDLQRLQTRVSGDVNYISLIFEKYLPDNKIEPYKEGDILLRFEKKNKVLYSYWGKLQPVPYGENKLGTRCFQYLPR